MACKYCLARGKVWEGSDPKCGFEGEGFSSDNWNCAAINGLWASAGARNYVVYGLDCSSATLPLPESVEGDFIILTRYKRRGKTDSAMVVDYRGMINPLEMKHVDAILGKEIKEDWMKKAGNVA